MRRRRPCRLAVLRGAPPSPPLPELLNRLPGEWMDDFDLECLRSALDLAALGPQADPNPRVGAVIATADGRIAGAGFHRGAGTPHAELAALADAAANGRNVAGGTAYVTLEPCAHTGRTGPCVLALIEARIARVVIARRDPSPRAGGGAELLRAAGAEVVVASAAAGLPGSSPAASPLLAEINTAAGELVRYWEHGVTTGRPFVTWKFAATLDGRCAAADGTSQWITGPLARADVHRLRASAGAIAVGTGTVWADDPALTVRAATGEPLPSQPLRVVVGRRDLPPGARVLRSGDGAAPALHLRTHDPGEVLARLHDREIRHLWLEGGPTLAAAFLRAGLVDEIVAYVAPALLGAGPGAVADLGIGTIGQIARFGLARLDRIGDDARLVLRPGPPEPPEPLHPHPVRQSQES